MSSEHKGENEALLDFIEARRDVQVVDVPGLTPMLAVPDGVEVQDLESEFEELAGRPRRSKGFAKLDTVGSFIAWVNRHKNDETVVFSNARGMEAVINYRAPVGDDLVEPLTGFADYGARFRWPFSKQWERWVGVNNLWLDQAGFAELLEETIGDVLDPSAAGDSAKAYAESVGTALANAQQLLTLSRGLTVRVSSKVANVQNLANGECQLQYEENHESESGAPLRVPGGFVLAIPVFNGGTPYQVTARLRYRIRRSEITWCVALHRAREIVDDATDEACGRVERETDVILFQGSPS